MVPAATRTAVKPRLETHLHLQDLVRCSSCQASIISSHPTVLSLPSPTPLCCPWDKTVHTSITRWHNCPGGLFSWNQSCQNWGILGWGPWSDSSLEAQVQVRNFMKEDLWVDPRRRSVRRQGPWPQICVQLRSFCPECYPNKTVEQSRFNGQVNGCVCARTFTPSMNILHLSPALKESGLLWGKYILNMRMHVLPSAVNFKGSNLHSYLIWLFTNFPKFYLLPFL